MDFPEFIIFRTKDEWRDWLEQNHASNQEIWIAIFKKKYHHKGISLEEAIEEAICFGWVDSHMKSLDEEKFILRFSPRRKGSPWSLINKNRAEKLIEQGKMTPAGNAMIQDAKDSGWWQNAYSSKEKPVLPDVLKEAFDANKKARDKFYKLSFSEQNRYVFWINKAKRQETRKKRILSILDKLG